MRQTRFYQFFRGAAREFSRDRCFEKAGALAFVTVLSFVPVMIVSLTIVAALFQDTDSPARAELQTFLVDTLFPQEAAIFAPGPRGFEPDVYTGPDVSEERSDPTDSPEPDGAESRVSAATETLLNPIESSGVETVEQSRELLRERIEGFLDEAVVAVGDAGIATQLPVLLGLIVISISLFRTIEVALNAIWQVERGRPLTRKIPTFWTVMTLGPVLLYLAFRAGDGLAEWDFFLGMPLKWTVHIVFLWVIVSALYKLVPHTHVPFRHAFLGAFCATFLVYLSKMGFTLYLGIIPTLPVIYGPLALVAIFLLWVWVAWVGVLFGAQIAVCRQYGITDDGRKQEKSVKGFHEYHGLRTMIGVARAYANGHLARADGNSNPKDFAVAEGFPPDIIDRLLRARLLIRSDEEEEVLVPARPLDRITVADVLDAVGSDHLRLPPDPEESEAATIQGVFEELRKRSNEPARSMTLQDLVERKN